MWEDGKGSGPQREGAKKLGDGGLWYVRRFHSHGSARLGFNVALLLLAFAALFNSAYVLRVLTNPFRYS